MKFLEEDAQARSNYGVSQRYPQNPHEYMYGVTSTPAPSIVPVRRDLEVLMELIVDLYRDRPDSGTKYWYRDGKLYLFVKWCADCKSISMLCSYTAMISSLACGVECAQHAFNFFNTSTVLQMNPALSWNAFFTALQNYHRALSDTNAYPFSSSLSAAPFSTWKEIHPEEVVLLQNFLNILRQILLYSESSRIMLFESAQWNALNRLFALLSCPISASLKAHLFNCLSAFATSPDIAMYIWQLLEAAEVLKKSDLQTGKIAAGIKYELEEIESREESYIESRAFLGLLLKIVIASTDTNVFKPWMHSNMFMGYVEFVINDIILCAGSRGYVDITEKWQMLDISLQIVSRLMNSCNFEADAVDLAHIKNISRHPGYSLMLIILSNDHLIEELLKIVAYGPSAIIDNRFHTIHFANCVCQVLQIFECILRNETAVLKRIISGDKAGIYRPLERFLIVRYDVVVALASFILCYGHDDIALWSVKLVYRLTRSPYFGDYISGEGNLFIRILKDQKELDYIKNLYTERLALEEPSLDSLGLELESNWQTVLCVSNPSANSQSIQIAIVELLLDALDQPSPNLTEVLLGFDLDVHTSSLTIPDPSNQISQQTCFYVLMDIFRMWIPVSIEDKIHTTFHAKSMELIYHLCAKQSISTGILRYLRTREDFFINYLLHMNFGDEPQIPKTVPTICWLYEISWFLRALSIDLHMAVMMHQKSYVTRVLSTFLGLSETITTDLVPRVLASDRLMQILKNLVFAPMPKVEQFRLPTHIVSSFLDEVKRAQGHLFDSWRILFGVIVSNCFEIFLHDWKNSVSINSLCSILSILKNESFDQRQGERLSEIVILLTIRWRTQIESIRELSSEILTENLGFSADLIVPLYTSMLDIILSTGSTVGFRANMHASLFNFLRMLQSWPDIMMDKQQTKIAMVELEHIQTAHEANVAYLENNSHRLIESMVMDLFEGPDVWKTVIFASLDTLLSYSLQMRSKTLLQVLIKRNVIRRLVQNLREQDILLQSVIVHSLTSMNPLYMYEAKMTFLMHVAHEKDGSIHLQECGLIEALCESRTLDLIPERAQHQGRSLFPPFTHVYQLSDLVNHLNAFYIIIDSETFIPPPLDRYYAILLPALDVSIQLLITHGHESRETAQKLLSLVYSHAEAFISILKTKLHEIDRWDLLVLRSLTLLLAESAKHEGLFEETMQIYSARFILLTSNLIYRLSRKEVIPLMVFEDIATSSTGEILQLTAEVSRNLFLFARAITNSRNEDTLYTLFQPVQINLKDLEQQATSVSQYRSPPVATLFLYLKDSMNSLKQFISQKSTFILKQSRIDELGIDEISQYAKQSHADTSQLTRSERELACFTELSKLISYFSHMIDILLSKNFLE